MPIPDSDAILGILPPHRGSPVSLWDASPDYCEIGEFCQRFRSTERRREILRGFLKLRKELFALGIRGFHWIDGSFLENIEERENRDPNDLDVITFVAEPVTPHQLAELSIANTWLLQRSTTRERFDVDHFLISLGSPGVSLIAQTAYWYGLFSHRRHDGVWKGMLRLELLHEVFDQQVIGQMGGIS